MDQSEPNVVPIRDEQPSETRSGKRRPGRSIPTDRMTFRKQVDSGRTFAIVHETTGSPVTNAEVAPLVKISEATITLTNPFFVQSGLLTRTKEGFIPSQELVAFKR